jgi:hypothetical protein
MRRMVVLVCLLGVFAVSVGAQVYSRPSAAPTVTAAGEDWFVNRVPITVGGEVYLPAGATVFFNGNTMVRSGYLGRVPLYVDTTVEPYSSVLVPAGRGLMQPYERRRDGSLAGTTGSRAPSFPVQTAPAVALDNFMAASSPFAASEPLGVGFAPPDTSLLTDASVPVLPLATSGRVSGVITPGETRSAARPGSNDGVWISWNSRKWVSSGPAVPVDAGRFSRLGDYAGEPVLARMNGPRDVIYLPSRAGFVAPYRLKE